MKHWMPEDILILAVTGVWALAIAGWILVESIRAWRRLPPETDYKALPPVIEQTVPPKIGEPNSGNG